MKNLGNTLLLERTDELLSEIAELKEQLNYEKQQHKHWETLAMIFHDELWSQLKK